MATGAYDYAFQARPYGLVLGFGGLALWAWQRRTETRSSLSLAVLAVGLAGAIMSHYYSVIQVALPLVLAESVRTIQRRRLDWPVALAMAVSAAPLLLVLPTLIEASSVYANFVLHAPQFFAKPRWSNALGFYTYQISAAILPAFIGLLAALVFAQSNKPNPSRRNLTLPESVALLAYAAMPLLMVAFTKWRTGYFRQRYAIMAFAGFTLLLCWAFNRYLPKLAPAAIAAALLVSITLTTLDGGPDGQQVMQWNGPVAAPPGQPVVIANPLRFLVLAHYSTPADRDRLYYLTDRATALTQPDFLPELSLLRGKPWLPGHIVDYHEFIAANPHFLVEYTASPALEWVPRKLSDDSCRLSWLPSSSRNRFLLQALRNP
jgi:hypothetical protein